MSFRYFPSYRQCDVVVLVCVVCLSAARCLTEKIDCERVGDLLRCGNDTYSTVKISVDPPLTGNFWTDIGVAVLFLVVGGLSFGLAFGFVSLDRFVMKVKYGKKHPYAKAIVPFVKMHSQLLVTLLLAFATSMQAIPLFLGRVISNPTLFLVSIPIIFFLGEILPCSICVRWTLTVGYWTRPFIWFLIFVLFPIAWPVAKVLDTIHGPASYSISGRPALKELVQVYTEQEQGQEGAQSNKKEDPFVAAAAATLSEDEVTIILGALNMREKKAEDAMTHLDEVFMLSDTQVLDEKVIQELIERGHSRVPIYHANRDTKLIVGMALTNGMLGHVFNSKAGSKVTVDDIEVFQLPCVSASMSLYKILNQFRGSKTQMAVVLDQQDNVTARGIITLEDIVSCLLVSGPSDDDNHTEKYKEETELVDLSSTQPIPSPSPGPPPEPLGNSVPVPIVSVQAANNEVSVGLSSSYGGNRSISHPPPFTPKDDVPSLNGPHPKLKEILLKARSNMNVSLPNRPKVIINEYSMETSPLLEQDNSKIVIQKAKERSHHHNKSNNNNKDRPPS